MEKKHTPGEWMAKKNDEMWSIQTSIRRTDGDNTIAGIYDDSEEAEADARLITAAPDMYDVLKSILDNYKKYDYKLPGAILFRAKEAIKKATI